MALPKEKLYTVDDIYALSDGTRAELIDGEMYMMTPPGRKHQELVSFLHLEIGNFIRNKNGNCKIYPAPFAVFIELIYHHLIFVRIYDPIFFYS